MTTPKWEAGKLYLNGDLVQPLSLVAAVSSALNNADAEAGTMTGWTTTVTGGTGTASVATDKKYAGTYAFRWQGAAGTGHAGGVECVWHNTAYPDANPGQTITASAHIALDDTGSSQNQGEARIYWYNSSGGVISFAKGTLIRGNSSAWKLSTVTATAPAGTVKGRLAVWTTANASGGVRFDNAAWNHVAPSTPAGLIYKAVQVAPGYSGSVEPAWPATLGMTVVDNQVTWEAVSTSRVVWRADPLLKSGATEPVWPTEPGASVSDGTISWECVSRRVEDKNCPNSKVVVIVASKVFAADKDIVRYSATANPLVWTLADDAGFLPTGLQQANANDMAVLNQYRGNLVALNANCFQSWQADADPAAMAILDQMDGIGSTWQQAAQPVANDLLFLSQLGVRSVGIAAGAENMAAGDVGMPIDVLVQDAIAVANANGTRAHSTYYPGAGQYWLAFADYPATRYETYFAAAVTGGPPHFSAYDGNNNALSVDTQPASSGRGGGWSPDAAHYVMPHDAAPFFSLYKRSGTALTKQAAPTFSGNSDIGWAAAWTADSQRLALGMRGNQTTYPFVAVFARSGDAYTQVASIYDAAAGTLKRANSLSYNSAGTLLAVTVNESPGLALYSVSGNTYTKIASPGTIPAGSGRFCAFSGDYLAYTHTGLAADSPLTVYKVSGQTITAVFQNTTDGAATGLAWSSDGAYLAAVVTSGTGHPILKVYSRSGNTFTEALSATHTGETSVHPAFTRTHLLASIEASKKIIAYTIGTFARDTAKDVVLTKAPAETGLFAVTLAIPGATT